MKLTKPLFLMIGGDEEGFIWMIFFWGGRRIFLITAVGFPISPSQPVHISAVLQLSPATWNWWDYYYYFLVGDLESVREPSSWEMTRWDTAGWSQCLLPIEDKFHSRQTNCTGDQLALVRAELEEKLIILHHHPQCEPQLMLFRKLSLLCLP